MSALFINIEVMKRGIILSIISSIILIVSSCVSNEAEPKLACDTQSATFSNGVEQIIMRHCSDQSNGSCHFEGDFGDGTFENSQGVLYPNIKAKVDDGSFESRVLESKSMPPSYSDGATQLTAEELCILETWIKDGAPNN